jgi:hypothetical protein
MKFIFGNLSALLFAAPSSKYSFNNERLQNAAQLYDEAQELTNKGEIREACAVYMQGIFMGRKIVQGLLEDNPDQDTGDDTDDAGLALDWMVSSYVACCKARIELGDWNTARSDAWAACTYSNYKNLEALNCMVDVCENTNDLMGELQALKMIYQLISSSSSDVNVETAKLSREQLSVEDVQFRMSNIEEQLEQKYSKS